MMFQQPFSLHNAYHQIMAGMLSMLNPRISESEVANPADLNGAVHENLRGNKAAHQPDFHFVVEDQALEQCSFEQLGLIAFDPDRLDWWSENESD